MTVSNTEVPNQYDEAIESLREINEHLFYGELKEILAQRENTLVEMNKEVNEALQNMRQSLEHFPTELGMELKKDVIDPQAVMFEKGIEHLNEGTLLLQQKVKDWDKGYQDYIQLTKNLLGDIKELQNESRKFISEELQKVLTEVGKQSESITPLIESVIDSQTLLLSKQYNDINQHLEQLSKSLAERLAESVELQKQWNPKILRLVEEGNIRVEKWQENWLEKWEEDRLAEYESSQKRENWFKKVCIGLAIGQGLTLIVAALSLIL